MQKMVLLPYDRYQRLMTAKRSDENPEESIARVENESGELSVKVEEPERLTKMSDPIERVLSSFPKSLQSRARTLLTYITPHLSWNENGEIVIGGTNIPGSNIVDLVKVQLKEYKDLYPIGQDAFSNILKDANVPLNLLASFRRVQTGQGSIPPPPGSPVKRKRKESHRSKWLRL